MDAAVGLDQVVRQMTSADAADEATDVRKCLNPVVTPLAIALPVHSRRQTHDGRSCGGIHHGDL